MHNQVKVSKLIKVQLKVFLLFFTHSFNGNNQEYGKITIITSMFAFGKE